MGLPPVYLQDIQIPLRIIISGDLSGANSEYEWLFDEKGKEFFYFCSSVTPVFMRFKSMINVVLKTISSNSCTHLERCTSSIGKTGNNFNIFSQKD